MGSIFTFYVCCLNDDRRGWMTRLRYQRHRICKSRLAISSFHELAPLKPTKKNLSLYHFERRNCRSAKWSCMRKSLTIIQIELLGRQFLFFQIISPFFVNIMWNASMNIYDDYDSIVCMTHEWMFLFFRIIY